MRFGLIVFALAPLLTAADAGQVLFQAHCAPCHGPAGDGGRGSSLALPRLLRAPDDAALSAIITAGIPGTQMPGTRMTADENRQLVAHVRSLGERRPEPAPGDASRGDRIFWGKGKCGGCHTVGPRGGRVGPDLTAIGAKRSALHLRTSLLDPEAETPETFAVYRRVIYMPDNFLVVHVVTADGRRLTGVRLNEDTFSIQFRDYSDRIHSFQKSELKEFKKDWGKSPMPGYRGSLTEVELQDLIAYLLSLRELL